MNEGAEVFRLLNTDLNKPFFTTSTAERDFLLENQPNLELEGVAFTSAPEPEGEDITGSSAVNRFLNVNSGDHLYTTSEAESLSLSEDPNYISEGIAFYGYDTQEEGTVPLYRLYNSELAAHFYTPIAEERDMYLDSPNFQLEGENGVAFYVEAAEVM